jgi:hypothetical protein
MNKIINFFKKLFSYIKNEIVMEQPELQIKNKRKRKGREKSRQTKVKNHLIEKGSIDFETAKQLYGTLRLSAIIHRLRNEGYNIVTVRKKSKFITYKHIN